MPPFADLPPVARRLLVGTCLDAIGNGFVLPFTIIYLHEVRHVTLGVAGLMLAASALCGLVSAPGWGTLVDRLGPRRVIAVTMGLSTVGALLMAAARSPVVAFLGLVAIGLGSGGLWPANQSLIAALIPSEQRHRYFAMGFAALNLGIGLGGLAAAAIVRPGHPGTYELLFLIDALTYVADGLVILPIRPPRAEPVAPEPEAPKDSYRLLLRDPALRWLLLLQFAMILIGYAQMDSGFPAYLRVVHVSTRWVGVAFTCNTVTIVAAQLFVQRRSAHLRRTRAIAFVAVLWSFAWALLAVSWWLPPSARPAMAIAYAITFAVGEMLFTPTIPALLNDIAPERLRGRANAAGSMTWGGAQLVGPIVAGALIGAGASLAWLGVLIAACFGAVVIALGLERVIPARANQPATEGSEPLDVVPA